MNYNSTGTVINTGISGGYTTFHPGYYSHAEGVNTSFPFPTKEDPELVKSIKEMKKNLEQDLNEKLIKLQGAIFNLQRISSRTEDFNSNLYSDLNSAIESMNELQISISTIQDQLVYCMDVLNSLKVSQELTDGFSEFKDKKVKYKGNTISNPTPNSGINIGQSISGNIFNQVKLNTNNSIYCSTTATI